jgi:hypothetical protein
MDAHRYQQIKTILADVLERPAHERAGMLTARCGADAALRAEVEALLAYDSDDNFLAPGAARVDLLKKGTGSRRVLKIVATRDGKVVWTDRVAHDTDALPGSSGVVSIPPFEIQLSIETLGDVVKEPTVRTPRER